MSGNMSIDNGLARKAVALGAAASYSTTDVLGLLVTAQGSGGNWTFIFIDGGTMTVPNTGVLTGKIYPFHLSSITSSTGGTAVLFIPS